MKKTSEPVIFFGSGPVAAKSLRLLAKDFTIEAVITKPRPPHHRENFPVLDAAKELAIPIYTTADKAELTELFSSNTIKSRLGILIDFGILVPQKVIDYFPLGIVNSHFSILPEWRGADPITFALLSGQSSTGVSLMLLVQAMDEGPLLAYGTYSLSEHPDATQLTNDLIELSYQLLVATLPEYIKGLLEVVPQTVTKSLPSYSRKLTKEDGEINWRRPAEEIERQIRAFIEWPKSHTQLQGKDIIITQAHVQAFNTINPKPTQVGEWFITDNKEIAVLTAKDVLLIDKLKPAGKAAMSANAFLAGYGQYLQ